MYGAQSQVGAYPWFGLSPYGVLGRLEGGSKA